MNASDTVSTDTISVDAAPDETVSGADGANQLSASPWRRAHVWIVIALVGPYVLLDRSGWVGDKQLHTVMEVAATVVAIFVGSIAFVRFRATRRQLDLFVAVGFVGTALLDGYHSAVTSTWFDAVWPSPPGALIPWSWNASRTYLALMLVIAIWSETGGVLGRSRLQLSDRNVIAVSSVIGLITLGLFALVPLPRAYYPELMFGRPEEFISALLFLAAFVLVVRDGRWRRDNFTRWLSASLLVGLVAQALYMPRSYQLFDTMFEAAHVLKVVSYLAVLVGLLISIDDLYRAEARASSDLGKMALAVENAADSIAIFDSEWSLQYSNAAFNKTMRATGDETMWDLCSAAGHEGSMEYMIQSLNAGRTWTGRRSVPGSNGSTIELEARVAPIADTTATSTGYVTVLRDITEQTELEGQLELRATRDPLTGLPNRAALLEMLDTAVTSRRSSDLLTAALFLDLDNFKLVNDSLGHAAGDDLLRKIGDRVAGTLRDDDIVGRLGGDEFLVLSKRIVSADEAMSIADRIVDAMGPSFTLAGRQVHATMSIGVALIQPGETAADLLAAADTAVYEAKSNGRNRAALFDTTLRQRAHEELEVANSLRASLERGSELVPYYQPVVDLARGEVTGFEALCRWEHPQRGLLAATAFIEIAERQGLEVPIGWSIMRDTTQQIAHWIADPSVSAPVCTNVNVSARQLRDSDFSANVRQCLDEARIPADLLCIEVTEQSIISDLDSASDALDELRRIGVKVAIDDFGVGNSSLNYIRSLPVDIVKIDMSFAQSITEGPEAAAIVAAVIRMAKALGHTVIAEGIESVEQMATLQALRCDRGQGYLYSPALASDAATDLLAGRRLLDSQVATR